MTTPPARLLDALRDSLSGLEGLREAQVWDGDWDPLESPRQMSFQAPAAVVSLIEFGVVRLGQTVAGLGAAAADPSPRLAVAAPAGGSVPLAADGVVRATVDVEVAVAVIAARPGATKRAATALDFASRAVPVLIAHGLRDVTGSNLASPVLRSKGLSGVVLVGHREVELDPPPPAAWCATDVRLGAG